MAPERSRSSQAELPPIGQEVPDQRRSSEVSLASLWTFPVKRSFGDEDSGKGAPWVSSGGERMEMEVQPSLPLAQRLQ
jgi:hypothetical protein